MTTPRSFAELLDECIDLVLRDGVSIEECMQANPEYAGELRESLETALAVYSSLEFSPSFDKKRLGRLRMLEALDRKGRPRFVVSFPRLMGLAPRVVVTALVAVVALLGSGTGTLLAAQGSIPGETLYSVKRASERVQLALAFSTGREANLRTSFIERRVDEMQAVAAKSRERFVSGLVDDITEHSVKVRAIRLAPLDAVSSEAPEMDAAVQIPADAAAPSSTTESEVTLRPVSALSSRLADFEKRMGLLEAKLQTSESRREIKELRRAFGRIQAELYDVVEKNDVQGRANVIETGLERIASAGIGESDALSTATGKAELAPALAPSKDMRFFEVRVRDVKVRRMNKRVVAVILLAEGNKGKRFNVRITHKGPRLTMDGERARLHDLLTAETVTLVRPKGGRWMEVRIPLAAHNRG